MALNTSALTETEPLSKLAEPIASALRAPHRISTSAIFPAPSVSIPLAGPAYFRVAQNEYIGNAGNGTFIQSGGTNGIQINLYIADGGNGAYSLIAGTLSMSFSPNYEDIGDTSPGTFIQTGGVNNMPAGILNVGTNPGVSGLYSLSASGVLGNGGGENIGPNGTFIQSGGINDISLSLFSIAAGGVYSMSAGTIDMTDSGTMDDSGSFLQSGGSSTLLGLSVSGLYSLSGTASLSH